ncbi:hypothetical protein HOK51_08975 [Candidatus Woesearchaeota archaeon]|jgi:hypothetical protein|nr:hypothetical protein [Candidatus Woesearchaeota archaeon]MBT6519961.1 hypothetical protein [Candidatus Woesearchaeota archaeon]MBT7367838.1 hypothetical protein [Candidatus Woesearchaeota archaeon]
MNYKWLYNLKNERKIIYQSKHLSLYNKFLISLDLTVLKEQIIVLLDENKIYANFLEVEKIKHSDDSKNIQILDEKYEQLLEIESRANKLILAELKSKGFEKYIPVADKSIDLRMIFGNILLYYLLKKNFENNTIKSVLDFIMDQFANHSMFYINSYRMRQHPNTFKILMPEINFLALKWFLNEQTKKLFSEEIIQEMNKYEKKFQEITFEKAIQASEEGHRKWFRLRT